MYFTLDKNEIKGLNRSQVLEKLTAQLKEFMANNKYKHSFFQDAKSVKAEWSGEILSNFKN
jgi:hypothetical protein